MFDNNISSISYGNRRETRPFFNPLNIDMERMKSEQSLSTNLQKERIVGKIDDNVELISALVECKEKIKDLLSYVSPIGDSLLSAITKRDVFISNQDALNVVYKNLFEDFSFIIEDINIAQKQKTTFVLPNNYIADEDCKIFFRRILNENGIRVDLEKNYIFDDLDGCVFNYDDCPLSMEFKDVSCDIINLGDHTIRMYVHICTDFGEFCFVSNDILLLDDSVIPPKTKIFFKNDMSNDEHILKNFNVTTKDHNIFCNNVTDLANDISYVLNGVSISLLYEVSNADMNSEISKISLLSNQKLDKQFIYDCTDEYCIVDDTKFTFQFLDDNNAIFQSEFGDKLVLDGSFQGKNLGEISSLLKNHSYYQIDLNSGDPIIDRFKRFDKECNFIESYTLGNKVVIQSKHCSNQFNFEIENLDCLHSIKNLKHSCFQNTTLVVNEEFVELENDLFKMENNFGIIVLELKENCNEKITIKSSINIEKVKDMIKGFIDSYNDFHLFIKKQNATDNNNQFLDSAILGKNHVDWNKKVDIALRKIDLINLGIKNSIGGFFEFDENMFKKSIETQNISKMVEQLESFYDNVHYISMPSGRIDEQIQNLNKKGATLRSEQSRITMKSNNEEEKFLINMIKANAAYITAMGTIDMMEKIIEMESSK